MSHTFNVDIHSVEGNEARVAVTGTVNTRRVAATVMRAALPVTDGQYRAGLAKPSSWPKKAKDVFAEALVDAFTGLGVEAEPHPGMIVVSRG